MQVWPHTHLFGHIKGRFLWTGSQRGWLCYTVTMSKSEVLARLPIFHFPAGSGERGLAFDFDAYTDEFMQARDMTTAPMSGPRLALVQPLITEAREFARGKQKYYPDALPQYLGVNSPVTMEASCST